MERSQPKADEEPGRSLVNGYTFWGNNLGLPGRQPDRPLASRAVEASRRHDVSGQPSSALKLALASVLRALPLRQEP